MRLAPRAIREIRVLMELLVLKEILVTLAYLLTNLLMEKPSTMF